MISFHSRSDLEIMDAIRKKMQSLKGETDALYATIQMFEDSTKESNRISDQVRFFQRTFFQLLCHRLIATSETMARKSMAWK